MWLAVGAGITAMAALVGYVFEHRSAKASAERAAIAVEHAAQANARAAEATAQPDFLLAVGKQYQRIIKATEQRVQRMENELTVVKAALADCQRNHEQARRQIGEMHEWAKGHSEGKIASRRDDDPQIGDPLFGWMDDDEV